MCIRDRRRGVIHVKIASKDGGAVFKLRRIGGTSQIGQIEVHRNALEQLARQVGNQLRVAGGPGFKKIVQRIIAGVIHGEQVRIAHLLKGAERIELPMDCLLYTSRCV